MLSYLHAYNFYDFISTNEKTFQEKERKIKHWCWFIVNAPACIESKWQVNIWQGVWQPFTELDLALEYRSLSFDGSYSQQDLGILANQVISHVQYPQTDILSLALHPHVTHNYIIWPKNVNSNIIQE